MSELKAAVLTPGQQRIVDFYQALNVPASWFIGQPNADGRVEVIALISDDGERSFIWSFIIAPDGDVSSSEATVGPFSTGINV